MFTFNNGLYLKNGSFVECDCKEELPKFAKDNEIFAEISQYLAEILPKHAHHLSDILLQTKEPKIFYLIGSKGGKSTFMNLLELAFGEEYFATCTRNDILQDKRVVYIPKIKEVDMKMIMLANEPDQLFKFADNAAYFITCRGGPYLIPNSIVLEFPKHFVKSDDKRIGDSKRHIAIDPNISAKIKNWAPHFCSYLANEHKKRIVE